MESFLAQHLADWGHFPYALIFIGMLLEGNVTLFTVGFLLSQGVFDPLAAILSLFAGALAEDMLWFWLGSRLKDKTSKKAIWAEKITHSFSHHLRQKTFRTVLISNFVYGIHRAVLFRAGMEKFKIKPFFIQVSGALWIWILIVGALGFGAGASVGLVGKYFKYAQVLLLVFVVVLLLFERYVLSGRLRKRL